MLVRVAAMLKQRALLSGIMRSGYRRLRVGLLIVQSARLGIEGISPDTARHSGTLVWVSKTGSESNLMRSGEATASRHPMLYL